MFLGHYGLALAAKRAAPNASLATLVAATQFIDLLWPVLLLLGVERVSIEPGATVVTPLDFAHYPYTHSLLACGVWGVLLGGASFVRSRNARNAAIIGALVVSHWTLDAVAHRPDLPLAPGNATRIGLGLWNSLTGTLIVEVGLFVVGVITYHRATRARGRAGSLGLGALVVVLALIYVANIFGPPPPSTTAIAVSALGLWLFVWWAAWVDRNRIPSIS